MKAFLTVTGLALAIVTAFLFSVGSFSENPAVANVKSLTKTDEPNGEGAPKLVVAELFTSQGCSSCPPADALAAKLVTEPGILMITGPVTYWDRLGWKDTLARPENTELQRAYARHGFAAAGVYTPQIVINGRDAAIGSREQEVRSLIRSAHLRGGNQNVQIQIIDKDGEKTVVLTGQPDRDAHITIVALSKKETVAVGRGENGGRTLDFTNVAISENRVGTWTGGSETFPIAPQFLKNDRADRYAVVVQLDNAGEIIAARYL